LHSRFFSTESPKWHEIIALSRIFIEDGGISSIFDEYNWEKPMPISPDKYNWDYGGRKMKVKFRISCSEFKEHSGIRTVELPTGSSSIRVKSCGHCTITTRNPRVVIDGDYLLRRSVADALAEVRSMTNISQLKRARRLLKRYGVPDEE
jgi:hypothetical protein